MILLVSSLTLEFDRKKHVYLNRLFLSEISRLDAQTYGASSSVPRFPYRVEQAKNYPRGGSAGRVWKVPPGEPARSTAPIRGRMRVSPAAATACSLWRRRDALIPVQVCYIAQCANYRLFVS